MTTALLPEAGWRLVRQPYADLSGTGARLYGGQWNSPGNAVVYLSADAALSVLEVRVHLDLPPDLLPPDYVLAKVDFAAIDQSTSDDFISEGPVERLSLQDSREIGDEWLRDNRSLLLRVPSVIVPESFNLLLNPVHPSASSLPAVSTRPFAFDSRLFE